MSYYNRFIIQRKLKEFIEEDCNYADVYSSIIPDYAETSAKIIAKSSGYISGLEELMMLFDLLNVSMILKKKDGEAFNKGDIIAELKGKTKDIYNSYECDNFNNKKIRRDNKKYWKKCKNRMYPKNYPRSKDF